MEKKFFRDRYSIISFGIILMILVVIYRLFTLQILNGQYYKNESEKKLLRVNTVKAPRGVITDRFGKIIANNRAGFTVEITKTKIDDERINDILLNVANILEKNKDIYKDNLPIELPYQFIFNSPSEEEAWKKKYKVSTDADAKKAFEELRKKYKISQNISDKDARKILTLRYEMSEQGYQSFKSVVLAFDVSKETVSEVEERNLEFPGINIVVNPIRNYPNGLVASHIIGYISKINQAELKKYSETSKQFNLPIEYSQNDIVGKSGIEAYSEMYLKGINGKKFVESDISGRLSRAFENQDPTPGGKVELTIDLKVQKAAEESLEETINKIKRGGFGERHDDVKGGAAIAVDVNTGGIIALANYPNFSSEIFSKGITTSEWNKLSKDPLKPLYNRALTGSYPPGSTFKMVTAVAALEEGKTTTGELIQDTGTYKYYEGYQPACWIWRKSSQTHGLVNVSEALKVSCNVYFYEIGRRLKIDKLYEYASKFGLDKKTNIEIGGEVASSVAGKDGKKRNNEMWYPGDTLQAAIGQSETTVTPIAMASYMSTLANGGKQYQIHLVKSQKSYDEKQIYSENSDSNPKLISEINIKPQHLRAVFEGMKSVADEQGGTAYTTFMDFPQYIGLGAKTGSAQTGIEGQSAHAWFVGFAPYENPKIAIVVLIENGGSGGYTAPVARKMLEAYFNLDNEQVVQDLINENSPDNMIPIRQVD